MKSAAIGNRFFKTLIFLALLLPTRQGFAYDPKLDWQSLLSENFIVHHPASQQNIAVDISRLAEKIHLQLSERLNWFPQGPTHIVLDDFTDYANGRASVVPFKLMRLNLAAPASATELADFKNWQETLLIHEYSHILHLDKKYGLPAAFRRYLGNQILFYPGLFQPAWITEGLATYIETSPSQQLGRGQSTFFQLKMTSELNYDFKTLAQTNLHAIEWPLDTPYLYGVYFVTFLVERYGEQKLIQYLDAYANNWIPYALNSTAKEIYGKTFKTLWQDFEKWLPGYLLPHQAKESIQITGEKITHHGGFSSNIRLDQDTLYYLKDDGHQQPRIVSLNQGQEKLVTLVQHNSRFDHHTDSGFIIAQPEYCDRHRIYYDLFWLANGEQQAKKISHCGRYHDVAWHPDGDKLLAIKTANQQSEVHLLNREGELLKKVWPGVAKLYLSGLDWSHDGQRFVSAVHSPIDKQWDIAEFHLASQKWHLIRRDEAIDGQPQYGPDGDSILFTSEHQGQYQVFQYKNNEIRQLSQNTHSAFYPALRQTQLSFFAYDQNGYNLFQQQIKTDKPRQKNPTKPLELRARPQASPSNQAYTINKYSPWTTLSKPLWSPILIIDSNEDERIGANFTGNDPLDFHNYQLGFYIDTLADEPGGYLSYSYDDRYFINISRNNRFFLYANDQLLFTEHQDAVEFFYQWPHLKLSQQWRLLSGLAVENRSFEAAVPQLKLADDLQDYIAGVALFYNNSNQYLYNISRSKGRQIYSAIEWVQERDRQYSGFAWVMDWREYFPLGKRHVLAMRQVLGATGEVAIPFELGDTFGDSYENYINVFNRRDFSLRGYDDNLFELQGRYVFLNSLEWRFPVSNIERTLMAPPIGIGKVHGKLFVDSGNAWSDSQNRDDLFSSVGAELMIHLKVFYNYPITGRIGVVKPLDPLGNSEVYGRIGLSF